MWGDARQPRDRRADRFTPYAPYCDGYPSYYTPTMPPVPQMYGALDVRAFRPVPPMYGPLRPSTPVYAQYDPFYDPSGDGPSPPRHGPNLAPDLSGPRLWDQTLQWNRDNRGSCLTMTQEDKDGRIWGVDMTDCMVPWDILRQDTQAPHMEIIWDVNKRQFRCRLERN